MEENCSTCEFAYKEDGLFGKWYCTRITERRFGKDYYVYVSPNNKCNHYMAITTKENSGFNGKKDDGGCFLTSACVEYLGKADDCEELTKLRGFRDEYLKTTDNGKALVEQYYHVAPTIVEKINLSQNKETFYEYIYQQIQKCILLIDSQKNEEALQTYKQMVNYLQEETKNV